MFLLILFFVASCASEQPCPDSLSVDISDAESLKDGTIVKNGVLFPPNAVYTKNVDFRKHVDVKENFNLVYGRLCKGMFLEDSPWYVQEEA
ncbi:hypothetical protein SFRURICE_005975 [Spodoptera frugiperda]|nr:hypothetical protein SFRURICE_005975 [Spodoptera frugiperda]